MDDPGAELAVNGRLTVLERAQHLKRRKELYLEKYPETKKGGAPGGGRGKGKKPLEERRSFVLPFAEDAAKKSRQTPRTIQALIKLAADLDKEAQEDLKGSPIEDRRSELTRQAVEGDSLY